MHHPRSAKVAAWIALAAIVLSVVAVVAAPFLTGSHEDAAAVAAAAQ